MLESFSGDALSSLVQVLLIDLVLAGDNAVAVGLAAAGLPSDQRRQVILLGLGAAVVMRIGFALITTQLLASSACCSPAACCCSGSAGRCGASCANKAWPGAGAALAGHARPAAGPPAKTFGQAMLTIVVADLSMSLDNVLAVAGAARGTRPCW